MKAQCRVSGGSKLGMMQKLGSHTISKEKPKIRIVHIVAPEIIKTDVDNFRALVQRLTGKGSGSESMKKGEKKVISSSMQKGKIKKNAVVLQKTDAFLSFLGDHGFMHVYPLVGIKMFVSGRSNVVGEHLNIQVIHIYVPDVELELLSQQLEWLMSKLIRSFF